jgi:hypothetical protein
MGIEYVHQPLLADAANADSGADRDAAPGAADSLRRGSDASADADAAAADAAASSSDMVDGAKATLAFARSCYICKSRCRRRLVAASWPRSPRQRRFARRPQWADRRRTDGAQPATAAQGGLSADRTNLPAAVSMAACAERARLNAGGGTRGRLRMAVVAGGRRYREIHHFYDQLCPKCAELNWFKR